MKDAKGHGRGTARGQDYRDAVSGFNRAAGTWAQGILDSAKLAAHQTGIGKLKTTDEMVGCRRRPVGSARRTHGQE